jgi:hypothetical protein
MSAIVLYRLLVQLFPLTQVLPRASNWRQIKIQHSLVSLLSVEVPEQAIEGLRVGVVIVTSGRLISVSTRRSNPV